MEKMVWANDLPVGVAKDYSTMSVHEGNLHINWYVWLMIMYLHAHLYTLFISHTYSACLAPVAYDLIFHTQ